MTPEAQRIAIAESYGLDVKVCGIHLQRDCCRRKRMPDFLNDLNACAEMEKTLSEDECEGYHSAIDSILGRDDGQFNYPAQSYFFHATAAQRCEAFLRVKGLWQDDSGKAGL